MARPPLHDAERSGAVPVDLGPLPEWDLTDLYPAPDAPQIAADLDRLQSACAAFAADYQGRLADLSPPKCWPASNAGRRST